MPPARTAVGLTDYWAAVTGRSCFYELQTHDGAVISVRNRVLTRSLKDKPCRHAYL
jgi:hypothetical protein